VGFRWPCSLSDRRGTRKSLAPGGTTVSKTKELMKPHRAKRESFENAGSRACGSPFSAQAWNQRRVRCAAD